MTGSFGYLTKAGYQGQRFPVVFGETGSFFTAVRACPPCGGLPSMADCCASVACCRPDSCIVVMLVVLPKRLLMHVCGAAGR